MQRLIVCILSSALFSGWAQEFISDWHINEKSTPCVQYTDHILSFVNDGSISAESCSNPIVFQQTQITPLQFGCELQGTPNFKAESWHCFIGLTDIIYQDDSQGKWVVISNLQTGLETDQWKQRNQSWLPPKPVKSLRLRVAFHAAGNLQVRQVYCREAPEKKDELLGLTAETFQPVASKEKFQPVAGIAEPLSTALAGLDWENVYPDTDFIWKIGQLNGSNTEFPTRLNIANTGLEFRVEEEDWKTSFCSMFSTQNRSGGNARIQKVKIIFKVPQPGTYTVITAFANSKNLQNHIALSLDGKLLRQYTIDGNHPGGKRGQLNRFAECVEMEAGQHDLILEHQAGGFISLDALALLPGTVRAQYQAAEFLPRAMSPLFWTDALTYRPNQLSAAGDCNIGGYDCDIILPLTPGNYQLGLTFAESFDQETNLIQEAGQRLFDVWINGEKRLTAFDIRAESKALSWCRKNLPVQSTDGKLVLRLKANSELPARISAITVYDATGQQLLSDYQLVPRHIDFDRSRQGYYSSPYNLVANPGLEYTNEKAELCWWEVSSGIAAKQSSAAAQEGKHGIILPPSIEIATLRSQVNASITWDRPYRMTFKVKAEGNCRIRPKLLWLRYNVQYKADIIKECAIAKRRYQHEYAGCSFGEWFEPDGQWRQVSLTAMPPRTADCIGFAMEFSGTGQISVDDFFCEIRGEVPVEIFVSQAGYDRLGRKNAVVFSRNQEPGTYIIRKADNRPIKIGMLQHVGRQPWYLNESVQLADSLWNREIWSIDFSDLQENGRYTLEVIFADGQTQRTPVWEIRDDLYQWLGNFVITEYYPIVRCGTAVPGWHPPCHSDDGDILLNGKRIHFPLHGGWHDAGDNNIFNWNVIHSSWAMSMFWENTSKNPRVWEEMLWGLDYQLRGQGKDGRLIQTVKSYPDHSVTVRADLQTDGDPQTPDNRIISPGLWIHPSMAAAIALLRSARNLPKEKAVTYVNCANQVIRYFSNDHSIDNESIAPYTLLLALAMEQVNYPFHRTLSVKEELEKVVRAFRDETHWVRWNHNYDSESLWQFQPILALCEYARCYPENAEEVKKLLRRHCDQVLQPLCEPDTFEQVREYRLQDGIFCKISEGSSYDISYRYYFAGALASCAEVLADEKLLRLAEAQILWGAGLNPCGVSAIAGIGWRQQNAFCVSAPGFTGHENGQYPGGTQHALINTVWPKINKIWPDPPADIPPYMGMPTGSRYAGILGDTPTFGKGAEQYIAHAAPFIYACGEIHRASKALRSKSEE
ncbi:MAG: glycoside hydrolase family 9 protein [Lentisphaeria bacterium]